MTYNNKDNQGCSARGIAKRETIDELLELAEQMKESICNVQITPLKEGCEALIPLDLEANTKKEAFRKTEALNS